MERELQEKIIVYRMLESRLDALLKQREMIVSKLIEMQTTLASMEEIEGGGEEILFPLGSEAYSFGKITNKKKMIVEIGARVALEKNMDEAKETLNKRKGEMENVLNALQKDMMQISSSLEVLGPEIKNISEKMGKEPKAG